MEDGTYDWNQEVDVSYFHLTVAGAHSVHKSLDAGDAKDKDKSRCGSTEINIQSPKLHYPNRKFGEGYYGAQRSSRVLVSHSGYFTLMGVTVRETLNVAKGASKYEDGIITLRKNGGCEIRDCRIEFTEKVFINSHADGEKQVNLGHVRFVGSVEALYPVAATGGQSWSGGRCLVSRSDAVVDKVDWRDSSLNTDHTGRAHFKIEYLS